MLLPERDIQWNKDISFYFKMRHIRLYMLWFLTSYKYHCFCPWGKQKGIYVYDLFVAPKNLAEVGSLPNKESFSSSHCLRGHSSLLGIFLSFFPPLSLFHNFFISLKTGQKVAIAKRNPKSILLLEAYKLEFLGFPHSLGES